MLDDPELPKAGKHRDLEKSNIKKSEDAVHRTVTAISNFMNPFRIPVPENPAEDRLYALHSGAPVPMAVEVDVKRAEALGKQQKMIFIEERLKEDKKSFFLSYQLSKTVDHGPY